MMASREINKGGWIKLLSLKAEKDGLLLAKDSVSLSVTHSLYHFRQATYPSPVLSHKMGIMVFPCLMRVG